MSDTWSNIQAHKKQLDSLRERVQRRRQRDPGSLGEEHRLMTSLITAPINQLMTAGLFMYQRGQQVVC